MLGFRGVRLDPNSGRTNTLWRCVCACARVSGGRLFFPCKFSGGLAPTLARARASRSQSVAPKPLGEFWDEDGLEDEVAAVKSGPVLSVVGCGVRGGVGECAVEVDSDGLDEVPAPTVNQGHFRVEF